VVDTWQAGEGEEEADKTHKGISTSTARNRGAREGVSTDASEEKKKMGVVDAD